MTRTVVLSGIGEPMVVDSDLAFRHSVNDDALAYWRHKKAGRRFPIPADLDPLEMRGFGPHVGLVDVLAGADDKAAFRIRVAGAAVEGVFGPVGGKALTELPDYFAVRWHNLFLVAVDTRAPLRATTMVTFDNKKNLAAEALLAPASDDGTAVSLLFVSVVVADAGEGARS